MNKEELIKKLQQIREFTDECLEDLTNDKTSFLKRRKTKRKKKKQKIGPTKPIEKLINKGFFSVGRKDLDVMKELKKKALNFKRKDIATALRRFVGKSILERDGEGTKDKPWKYMKEK